MQMHFQPTVSEFRVSTGGCETISQRDLNETSVCKQPEVAVEESLQIHFVEKKSQFHSFFVLIFF